MIPSPTRVAALLRKEFIQMRFFNDTATTEIYTP